MRRLWPLLLILFACRPTRPSDAAAADVEIERAVLWEFRNERRFDDVRVSCRDRRVTLRGRVATRADAEEARARARRAARHEDRDAEVRSELDVREK